MDLDRSAIDGRTRDRKLEFARQECELGMQARPLAQQFRIGARIDRFVGGGTGKMVCRDVANAVARRLDRMHLDFGEFGQDVRDVGQPHPVELQILARGEMAAAAVVDAPDMRKLAQLSARQHAVRNRDAQHVGVELQIDAVH